jgi:hypothetical protein
VLPASKLQWLSNNYEKYVREEIDIGRKYSFRCEANHRRLDATKRGYPTLSCVVDPEDATKAKWSAGDTCVVIPTQTPCSAVEVSNGVVTYSDITVGATTKKVGSSMRVKCSPGFYPTGMTSYYGKCQASEDGKAMWSNLIRAAEGSVPQCSRQPFRIGDIETKPNIVDSAKCPLDKPIVSASNLCTVSSGCRDHVVGLFDDALNFQLSRASSSSTIDQEKLTQ